MNSDTELTITVKVDTEAARRAVSEFRQYALRVAEELRSEFASLGQGLPSDAGGASYAGRPDTRRA